MDFWFFVLVGCLLALLFLVPQIIRDEIHDELPKFKWGDPQRRAPRGPLYFPHWLCFCVTMFVVINYLHFALENR